MNNRIKDHWFKLVAVIFLLGALGYWPYGYYQILKWVVCAASAYAAFLYYESGKVVWTWIFGVMAVLFNPILPIRLSKEIWQPIDVIAAIIFLVSIINKNK